MTSLIPCYSDNSDFVEEEINRSTVLLCTSENYSARDLMVAQGQMEKTTLSSQRSRELRLEQGHLDTLARQSGLHFTKGKL